MAANKEGRKKNDGYTSPKPEGIDYVRAGGSETTQRNLQRRPAPRLQWTASGEREESKRERERSNDRRGGSLFLLGLYEVAGIFGYSDLVFAGYQMRVSLQIRNMRDFIVLAV